MREIKEIFIHCTATSQQITVERILNYWKKVKGWTNPGYHFLIEPSGIVNQLIDMSEIANGVKGRNETSIHIAYIGGIDDDYNPVDNRTDSQVQSMILLLKDLSRQFPAAKIRGHNEVSTKACPSFDVQKWIKSINL